ncbi:unnamed protein product [Ilex paraguariensis]|uniref:Uncharacterized protein n=1 Tax=Ilex paraguariensis TaxID=185542 RepID=A0ABC8UQQ4_9AQUA
MNILVASGGAEAQPVIVKNEMSAENFHFPKDCDPHVTAVLKIIIAVPSPSLYMATPIASPCAHNKLFLLSKFVQIK